MSFKLNIKVKNEGYLPLTPVWWLQFSSLTWLHPTKNPSIQYNTLIFIISRPTCTKLKTYQFAASKLGNKGSIMNLTLSKYSHTYGQIVVDVIPHVEDTVTLPARQSDELVVITLNK